MAKGKLLILFLIGALFLGACKPEINNGIEGRVLIGPTCSELELDRNCEDFPYQAIITILDANFEIAGKVQTDSDGRFKIRLAPGTYRVFPESLKEIELYSDALESSSDEPFFFPIAEDQLVEVDSEKISRIDFTIDSGIR